MLFVVFAFFFLFCIKRVFFGGLWVTRVVCKKIYNNH